MELLINKLDTEVPVVVVASISKRAIKDGRSKLAIRGAFTVASSRLVHDIDCIGIKGSGGIEEATA